MDNIQASGGTNTAVFLLARKWIYHFCFTKPINHLLSGKSPKVEVVCRDKGESEQRNYRKNSPSSWISDTLETKAMLTYK